MSNTIDREYIERANFDPTGHGYIWYVFRMKEDDLTEVNKWCRKTLPVSRWVMDDLGDFRVQGEDLRAWFRLRWMK